MLKDILSYDENYEDAVKALADIYYKKEDADNLTNLIRKYQDGKCSNAVKNYIVKEPSASKDRVRMMMMLNLNLHVILVVLFIIQLMEKNLILRVHYMMEQQLS